MVQRRTQSFLALNSARRKTMPGNLNCVYLVNSGSEANDLAIQMARLYTGNYDVLSLRNAYHGKLEVL